MKQKGFFWHVHHDKLLEYCYNYEERVKYIREYKPEDEVETRLRLFKPVKGKLPKAVVEAAVICGKAYAACDRAGVARDKAYVAWNKTDAAWDKADVAYDMAYVVYNRAYVVWDKASVVCDKAYVAYDKAIADNLPVIEKLHTKECPDCPWDGEQIVF